MIVIIDEVLLIYLQKLIFIIIKLSQPDLTSPRPLVMMVEVVIWLVLLQQGVRFDPDLPQTIRLEFAKSNTKVSKPKQMVNTSAVTQQPIVHPLTGRK